MLPRRTYHAPPQFVWIAAAIATALAAIGALIVVGAGPTPVGRIMAVLVGFLLLGAGAVVALAIAAPEERWHSSDDWNW